MADKPERQTTCMIGEHLTACWCWEKLTSDTAKFHMAGHRAHEAAESFNIMIIAWEVAQWESTDRKDTA